METATKTVAKINDVSIVVIENGKSLVPIRPICDALGVDYSAQLQKIKSDEILAPVMGLSPTTGADGKTYEMACIPYKFVFGWLFTISPKNVNPEISQAVTRYKLECYDALFKNFTDQSDFLRQKQAALEEQMEEVERIRFDFKHTKQKLDEAREKLNEVKEMTFEKWQANNQQLKIEFTETADESAVE